MFLVDLFEALLAPVPTAPSTLGEVIRFWLVPLAAVKMRKNSFSTQSIEVRMMYEGMKGYPMTF